MTGTLHFLHRCLRYRWRTERLQLATLGALNLRGASVLDIGANHGIYCFWLARAIGPQGRLRAIEPQPELADALVARGRAQRWPGFVVDAVGLSDAPGSLRLYRSRVGDGSATLDTGARERLAQRSSLLDAVEVPVVTLDTLLAAEPGPFVYVKCDVEGHELAVLDGGMGIIERDRPILQIEIRADDERTPVLIDRLAERGYRGVMMLDGRYHDWRDHSRVASRRFGLIGHRDLLCFDPEVALPRMSPALARKLTEADTSGVRA